MVARLFNTVGPRQTGLYRMVIPRFVEQAMAGGPITDDIISIRALADHVRSLVNPSAGVSYVSYEEAYGVGFEDLGSRQPDLSRLRELIGYAPTHSLDDIIRDVAEYARGAAAAKELRDSPTL